MKTLSLVQQKQRKQRRDIHRGIHDLNDGYFKHTLIQAA